MHTFFRTDLLSTVAGHTATTGDAAIPLIPWDSLSFFLTEVKDTSCLSCFMTNLLKYGYNVFRLTWQKTFLYNSEKNCAFF